MNIIMYTKSHCPNCTAAKKLLDTKGLPYAAADIDTNPALRDDLPPDARQMPQIFINGQRVGGLAGLRAALDQIFNNTETRGNAA